MKAILKRRAATVIPAVAAALLAGGLATAPAAQASGSDGCAGGYAKYTSKGDYLYVKDRKADGRSVFVNLEAASGKPYFWDTFQVTRGAGKSYTWDLDLPEKRTVRIIISLVKGDPYSADSKWTHCATFTSRT
ncbi:hypothetical protein ABZ876_06330 [Streptomyces sp. NPDC046931]|uniref:hypothetical protein n=1 Tax=Streptomyces sp. NPDC046931 TaxID=3154806 RepID=UPI00340F376F